MTKAGHSVPSNTEGETYRLVIEASPSAMIMIDRQGEIVLANRQVEILFGYDREELYGNKVEILLPSRYRFEHSKQRDTYFIQPQVRSMGAGRDLYGLRKDGVEVPIEIGLNPVQAGGNQFVLASILDISERKRAEETFRLVVEASPSAMIMVNSSGDILMVNKQVEHVFGYSREELFKQKVEKLIPLRFRPDHPSKVQNYAKNPTTRSMGAGRDLFGLHKDGHEIPIEIGLNPIQTIEGRFVLASVIDITQRIKAENEMKIEVLLEEVHHRIKNNLAIISSIMQMESRRLDPNEFKLKSVLKSAINRIASIANLHESLYKNKKFDLIDLTSYLKRLSQDILMSFENDLSPNTSFEFTGDECNQTSEQSVPLGLIFNEFVTNSIKHSSTNERLVIKTSLIGDEHSLIFKISDNGTGFNFNEIKATSKTLGLKVIDMLAFQLEASITWDTDQGTSLELTIPVQNKGIK